MELKIGGDRFFLWGKNMDKEKIRRRLEIYLAAEEKILLSGQSYTIGNRTLTRADLGAIRKTIADLEAELAVKERRIGQQKRAVLI